MPVELVKEGLKLVGSTLCLDAHRKTRLSFVSHAHGDHIARHARIIASKETAALAAHRLGRLEEVHTAPFGRRFELDGLSLELFSAGHILGAAQLRVTREDGHRLVFTGDLGLQPNATTPPADVVAADTLVLESTFGHPRFRFPPREQVFDEVFAWAKGALERGLRPLVYAYALGKAQEAVKQLSQRGLSLCVHPDIHALNDIYRAHGVELHARPFDGLFHDGEVGVFPPWGRSRELRHVERKVTAVLTGWALDPGIERRYGAERAFPISDHADFPSLLAFAKATGAREVLTHHGYAAELAQSLRDVGVLARPVDKALQLALPL